MDLNTSLIFPLSGETIFNGGGSTVTYNVSGHGILYLTGIFGAPTQTVVVTLNTRAITFTGSMYVPNYTKKLISSVDFSTSPRLAYVANEPTTFISNLLTPVAISNGGFTFGEVTGSNPVAMAADLSQLPASPTDRNQGPYLPVRRGNVLSLSGTGSCIASILYFN